jgi:hypothetical protein
MRVQPALSQTTAAQIPAGNLFAAQTPGGSGGLFLRVAGTGSDVTVVQIAPRGTQLNWLGAIDGAAVVSDVTDAVVLAYDPAPSNLRFPTLESLSSLVAGDLLVDGASTKLVCVGPNPASGIGFVDLDTGEISSGIGPNPMLVVSWVLEDAA